ncbi:MAG: hypothetical protein IPK91_10825 [Saprospiraceae bacterium]|nr:hypothetical protein [Saprospiraceae bacterium]
MKIQLLLNGFGNQFVPICNSEFSKAILRCLAKINIHIYINIAPVNTIVFTGD